MKGAGVSFFKHRHLCVAVLAAFIILNYTSKNKRYHAIINIAIKNKK